MADDLINLNKVEKMAYLALKNGLRLHEDSILLFNKRKFPSAYFLSILALEEIGKFFLLEDFWWHSKIDGRMEKEWEEKFISIIYFHREKQNNFAYNLEGPVSKSPFTKEIFSGVIEKKKQDAVYVGLPREKRKINLKGRITSPFRTTEDKTKQQITYLNDKIIEFTKGVIKGVYSVETESANKALSRYLSKKLIKLWPRMNKSTKIKIKRIEEV